jgi:hypothetical protein
MPQADADAAALPFAAVGTRSISTAQNQVPGLKERMACAVRPLAHQLTPGQFDLLSRYRSADVGAKSLTSARGGLGQNQPLRSRRIRPVLA